jgi:HTH-type transcriptional regulator/antitoxin HigA
MTIKPIKSEADYHSALKQLIIIFDAPAGSKNSDEAALLGLLIVDYEKKHYPIEAPDSIEAIKIRMEELHLKQIDLFNEIGGKSRVSEILNRKRKLTVVMILNLNKTLNLSPDLRLPTDQVNSGCCKISQVR